jgi:hypothetical protein
MKYTPSYATNIRKLFRRVRRELGIKEPRP